LQIILSQPISRSDDIEENFEAILDSAAQVEGVFSDAELLVLPELIGAASGSGQYEEWVKTTARTLGCTVVGGSHHELQQRGTVNCGVVVSPDGTVLARYDKHSPYGSEIGRGIVAGSEFGRFALNGRHFLVLICADLWHSESFHEIEMLPDVVLTPSFSVTQKPDPTAAQNLWKHMAVSRAYEFATYVGVSDWAHPCEYDGLCSCGVAGLASPLPDGAHYFEPIGDTVFRKYRLSFSQLDELRENRIARDFLWHPQWTE